MSPAASRPGADRIDWSQLWYPGPTRVFTDAELARAGQDRPGRTVVVVSGLNVALMAFKLLQMAPKNATALLTGWLAGCGVAVMPLARSLWRRPSRRRLMQTSLVFGLLCIGLAFGMKHRIGDPEVRQWAFATGWVLNLLVTSGLTGLTPYRSHQIAARLRELDERDRAVEMARQLATAQTYGASAMLTLQTGAAGGCEARVEIPFRAPASPCT